LAEHETSLAQHEIRIPGIDRISTDLCLPKGPFLLRRLMLRPAMDTLLVRKKVIERKRASHAAALKRRHSPQDSRNWNKPWAPDV
jgi:hypothetical protein